MVLGARADDTIAGSHAQRRRFSAAHALRSITHRESDQIDRLGRVLRPDDFVSRYTDERGQSTARTLKCVGRFVAKQVCAPVDRAITAAIEVGLGVDDACGLLGCRGGIQVRNGRAAAPDATQNRKIRTNRVELGGGKVSRHGDQRPRYLS